MPITITLPSPTPFLGWGGWFSVSSDFIGPIATGSTWNLKLDTDPEFANLGLNFRGNTVVGQQSFHLGDGQLFLFSSNPQQQWIAGQTVHIEMILRDPSGVALDSGNTSAPWDPTAGLHQDVTQQISAQAGHGLTSAQATQLQQVHDQTQVVVTTPAGDQTVGLNQLLALPTLDALTLTEVTTGPTAGFASVELPNNAVGVIIRITSVGSGYAPTSPDDGWYIPELAVANFFRGSDLVARVGIHTVSRFIYPIPGAWAYWTTTLFGGDLPPDMSVQVTFAAGNLGQLFYTKLP